MGAAGQIGMNSPLHTPTPLGVRGPHHDALAEIWGGLFYLKHDDDQSDGAALQGPWHLLSLSLSVSL